MAGLSAPGLGSGLDVQGIVSQLMALERRPLQAIQQRQKQYEADLSAYGTLKSAISSLQDAMKDLASVDAFKVYNTSVTAAAGSDTAGFTATASSSASDGAYDVRVVNLAEAHKLRSAGIADADNSFGGGSLNITLGSNSAFQVDVTSGDSLESIRTAINSHADNPGVTASIIDDGTNKYLTFTADDTGASNTIDVVATDDGTGASSLTSFQFDAATLTGNMTQLRGAEDARIEIDNTGGSGFTVSSESNTVTGVIEGVTLNLTAETSAGQEAKLAVSRDSSAVNESVQAFVTAYNQVRSKLSDLRGTADSPGKLNGDNALLTIESQLRSVLNTPPNGLSGSFSYLSEVGITTERDGSLSLDLSKLDDALTSDFAGVAELFGNNDQGYAFRMEALADGMLDYDGLFDSKEDSLNSTIDRLEDQALQWEYRLEQAEERFLKEFSALDTSLVQMQSTSAYLSQQLAGLM